MLPAAGLAEDDEEEDGVDECAVAGAEFAEVTVDVQDKIKDGAECAAGMQDKDKGEEDGAGGEEKGFFVHGETGERDGAGSIAATGVCWHLACAADFAPNSRRYADAQQALAH